MVGPEWWILALRAIKGRRVAGDISVPGSPLMWLITSSGG